MSFNSILQDLIGIPEALKTCLEYYISPKGNELLNEARRKIKNSSIKRVVFIGHTYNYFASFVAFRYINSRYQSQESSIRKICAIYEIDEFLSYFSPNKFCDKTLFIFVSRTGNSIQIKMIK